MKSNKFIILIVVVITGILIGNVLKTKIDYEEPINIYEIKDINSELRMIKGQLDVNEDIIAELENKAYKLKSNADREEYKKNLEHDLEKIKQMSSSTDVKGEGIIIKMSDSNDEILKNTNFGIVHDIDIINILNELRLYGAEAISVNDVRIVETSTIKCGGPVVRIDNIPKAVPFVIKAIGNKEKLFAGLYETNGYLRILKDVYKVEIEVEAKDEIFIPKRVSWC